MEEFIKIIILGLLSTASIDIWATFSNRYLGFPRTNWALVGRWIGHIPKGVFFHRPVSSSPEIGNEKAIGWLFHYFIGIVYAAFYFYVVTFLENGEPTIFIAWIFGLVTILSPWFIMQPALGLGICAVKAPSPNMVRLQNFAIHSIFGIALYYGWVGINA